MFCNDLWASAFNSDIHRARRLNRTWIWQNRTLLQQEITQHWQKETFPSLTHKTRSRHLLISPSTKSKKLQTLVYELEFIHILARKEDAQTLDYANEETPQHRITWIKLRRLHLHCQSWGTLLAHTTYTRMERNTHIYFWFCFKSSETRIAKGTWNRIFLRNDTRHERKSTGEISTERRKEQRVEAFTMNRRFSLSRPAGGRGAATPAAATNNNHQHHGTRQRRLESFAYKEHWYELHRPVVWKQQMWRAVRPSYV